MSPTDVAIVGGGISGLSALHFIRQLHPTLSVRLFEAAPRLGGTIGTDRIDGYSFDWGPNGFLDREPLVLQLCDQIGLTDQLERANENVSNRFILRHGKLRAVPMSPGRFIASDILSTRGKLRVLGEPFARGAVRGVDESIYDFGRRRIGKEAADYLIQPMVSGIYGGMADRLSLQSCFPIMKEMETQYGSLTKAMIARARQARKTGKRSGGPSGPGGWLTSFYGGLSQLTERLGQFYTQEVTTCSSVTEISKDGGQFGLLFEDGRTHKARIVTLATPVYEAARIVEGLSESLAAALSAISYAPISVVCSGYDASAVRRDISGFGFLVPARERRRILGSIWTSSIFRERAPEGKVQFRTMVGGDGDHASADLTDDELQAIVHHDLDGILGITGSPEIVKIYRWRYGIPQFAIGHAGRLATIEKELHAIGRLFVTGNAYYGIGLNDCIKQSHRVASSIRL